MDGFSKKIYSVDLQVRRCFLKIKHRTTEVAENTKRIVIMIVNLRLYNPKKGN